jgi:hypothetical protein
MPSRIVPRGGEAVVRLDEIGLHTSDTESHVQTHKIQQQRQWRPFGNGGFIERYLAQKAHILLRVRNRDGQEFLAYVERFDSSSDNLSKLVPDTRFVSSMLLDELILFAWRHGTPKVHATHSEQEPVLIDVVEAVEGPQRVIPSLVRLQPVDLLLRHLPHAWYLSGESGLVLLGTIEYREACLRGGFATAPLDQKMDRVIQGTTHVLEHITQHEAELDRKLGDASDEVTNLSGMVIHFGSDTQVVGLPEKIDSVLEIVDVLVGPVVLG